ncbi:hypothetical protein OG2516_09785 [Oceanicola granulosus HTCC2516]|uniref:HPt domain-containing protein n=1 Tax=Oceanicola granulosus (strain ATCC BAA-861 / DSM 15982 / KCTC 12143 / HTCC2516) TaxID=314256 RepID=Q2CCU7_OCEGH|nr:hypothetical protein [Oceanicola granulosus]EAR50526.1 hypothetical protein OG2516_09785 [Oceanicola granulosus HTCC2516]
MSCEFPIPPPIDAAALPTRLCPAEGVRIDRELLARLHAEKGEAAAEELVCGAVGRMEDLLSRAARDYCEGRLGDLAQTNGEISGIALRIGLISVAQVAAAVTDCLARGDTTALGATLSRLTRVGDRSMFDIWDARS